MPKILVVDDEPDLEALVLQKFRRQIRDGAMSFVFAHDGVAALEEIARTPDLDLVVSDINMPRMDGLTLLGKLQESADRLSTIIVSAYGDMTNIRTAMNRGAFDFLTKPIDFTDFEATVTKTLRHVGDLREARTSRAAAERAHAALARYFSPNLAAELALDGGALDLKGRRREISVMFTDIAGFTTLVETLDPDLLGDLLNEYFGGVTAIVFEHGGTVAKVMGDALNILFGAPREQADHAARAVACALAVDRFCEGLRTGWRARGAALGATRIGLHAGPALVGNFGRDRFFDYTAHGDTINTASRLESANKEFGTRICASAAIVAQTPGFRGRPIGNLLLRGRSEPLAAFEPTDPAVVDAANEAVYRAAFEKLGADDPSALAAFAALVGAQPQDHLASFHLRRLLNGQSGTTIAVARG